MELETHVRVARRNAGRASGLAIAFGLLAMPVVAHLTGSVVGLLPGFAIVVFAAGRLVDQMRRRRARVVVESDALVVGDRRIARADIAQGYVLPASANAGPRVVLEANGTDVRIDVLDEARGNALLDALDLGVDRHTTTFSAVARGTSPTGSVWSVCLLAGALTFAIGLVAHTPPIAVAASVFALVTCALLVPASVHVGRDGLLVKGRLHTELYGYEEITAIVPTARGVELALGAKVVDVPMTVRFALDATELPQREALVGRVREGMRRHAEVASRPSTPRADVGPWLERGDRPFAEWLRSFGDDETATFRKAPIREDDLVRLVEDPAPVPAARRVAAAIALARRGGERERDRIRVAAQAVAAPKLRVALETIARGTDDATLEARVRDAEEEASIDVAARS